MEKDTEPLIGVINYHVVNDDVTCRAVFNNKMLETAQGSVLRINEYSQVSRRY